MSRMKLLLDVIEDIRSLADSLQAVAAALGQSDTEDTTALAPPPEMPPAPAPADPPPKAITLEGVRAVLAEGELLVMDEPFKGLDPVNREKTVNFVMENLRGRTLIAATHEPQDVELLRAELLRL